MPATAPAAEQDKQSITLSQLQTFGIEISDPAVLQEPAMQAKLRQLLEEFKRNPLFGYFPHEKQAPFHALQRKIKVFLGGERSGKTVAGILDDLIQAVDKEVLPPHLLPYKFWEPPFWCRIITPDYGQGYQEMLNTLREWCPTSQLHGGSWEVAYTERNHRLLFANGSFLEFMTQEQDVGKFGGTSRHRLHYDEEAKGTKGEAIREANVYRLAQFRGDEVFTFSPVHGFGWTWDALWEKRGEEIAPKVWDSERMILVIADQDDNPHLDAEGKREAEEKIPERMLAARKSGMYVHKEGLVYETFSESLHVCDPLDPEFVKGLEQVDCIDPGLNTGVLLAGFDSDNVLWVYDELYLTDSAAIPENVAAAIRAKRAREWKLPLRPKRTLIDPASAARQNQTNERTDSAYRRAGMAIVPAKNDVELGIFEIMRRLDHRGKSGAPRPLLKISRNCTRLLWELRRYRRETDSEGKVSVIKAEDHEADCLRYIGLFRPLPLPPRRKTLEEIYIPGQAPSVDAIPHQRGDDGGPFGKFS